MRVEADTERQRPIRDADLTCHVAAAVQLDAVGAAADATPDADYEFFASSFFTPEKLE